MPKGKWVYNRYEKMRDAEKALKVHSRKDRWPGKYYAFHIVDTRKTNDLSSNGKTVHSECTNGGSSPSGSA